MGWLIISIISGLLGLILVTSSDGTAATVNNTPVGAILVAVAVLCVPLFLRSNHRKKIKFDKIAQDKQRKESLGIELETQLKLVDGLPLAPNTMCTFALTQDRITITAAEQTFQIALPQIIAAQSKSDVEIQQEVTSSLAQGVVGGFLFGPVGAIVGSRTQTKKNMISTYYVIFNYSNQDGETAVLSFEGNTRKICDMVANAVTDKIRVYISGKVTNL